MLDLLGITLAPVILAVLLTCLAVVWLVSWLIGEF